MCGCLTLAGCAYGGSGSTSIFFENNAGNVGSNGDITPISKSGIYFDTIITITLYGNDKEKYIDECFKIADKYEALFSKSINTSDIARVNSSNGEFVKVSDDTIYILQTSKKYSEMSDGKFSLVCGALTSLWDIGGNETAGTSNAGNNNIKNDNIGNNYIKNDNIGDNGEKVPSGDDIKAAMQLVGDDKIEINKETNEIRILVPGAMLDFGAAAKGYIADKMKEYLINEGIESGIISLGGNILLIGNKPTYNKTDGEKYTIGITKPFSDNNEMITTLQLSDTSVATSGNYQRYFEQDGKLYHHIIDLTTGYPADTGLNSVSIICPSSLEADIMSTTCYLLGKEKGTHLCESLDLEAIFVSYDNEIIYKNITIK